MAPWPAHLGDSPPHGPEWSNTITVIIHLGPDVLLKRGETLRVFTEFVARGSK